MIKEFGASQSVFLVRDIWMIPTVEGNILIDRLAILDQSCLVVSSFCCSELGGAAQWLSEAREILAAFVDKGDLLI